ncbi:MAG TPA: polysaccharide biosynthesis C-terminal domain-containing protein [Candidatus Dorea gallistercoris]|uniref:Polysaccharide biosynthesis C-terminal domain-containing protein n=1 Tax=Candidatus Dorea gallistercoris TaxID=2838542 RepID=A0A9D1R8A3_9FIRM|nr:polysaccharide biosynthesis C-terminal domain-containing protein [Candidatus Dorea gallistercoris]
MRSRQAAKNMIASIFLQGVVFLSGIILPRFFLREYGSNINGMVTSVNQFLVYLGLAEAGIGTASLVALYAPLARRDQDEVNGVLSASRRFYNRSGYLFGALTAGLVLIYPYLITQQLSASLVRTMIVILASSTLVDYFCLGKYKVLLTADQRGYVVSYIQAFGTILNMLVTILLIGQHANVLVVKAAATLVYILRFFFVRAYVRRHYKEVDFQAPARMDRLKQKNAALLHQVVGVIVNNTDVALLTICLGSRSLLEVSVYGTYNMVVYAINLFMNSFSNGLTAGFGEVISKKEKEVLKQSFSGYEYVFTMVVFCIFVCVWVLLLPFISVYTLNVTDAEYIRPLSAVLFTLIVLLQNIRIPGLTIISAAGHFRETRRQAILEAVINIVVSLALIWKYGMNGVLFGTVCSYGYRSFEILVYNSRHLIPGTGRTTLARILRNAAVSAALIGIGRTVVPWQMTSFMGWGLYGAAVFAAAAVCLGLVNYLCEPEEFQRLFRRFQNIMQKGK